MTVQDWEEELKRRLGEDVSRREAASLVLAAQLLDAGEQVIAAVEAELKERGKSSERVLLICTDRRLLAIPREHPDSHRSALWTQTHSATLVTSIWPELRLQIHDERVEYRKISPRSEADALARFLRDTGRMATPGTPPAAATPVPGGPWANPSYQGAPLGGVAKPRSAAWPTLGILLLIAGGIAVVLGIVGLLAAEAYKPSFQNAFTRDWVLKPGAYGAIKAISYILLVGGVLAAVWGIVVYARPNFTVALAPADGRPTTSAPTPSSTPPAGWFPDPALTGDERWWDGRTWTHHSRAAPDTGPGSAADTPRLDAAEGPEAPVSRTSETKKDESPGVPTGAPMPADAPNSLSRGEVPDPAASRPFWRSPFPAETASSVDSWVLAEPTMPPAPEALGTPVNHAHGGHESRVDEVPGGGRALTAFCEACGAGVEQSARYCGECGHRQPVD